MKRGFLAGALVLAVSPFASAGVVLHIDNQTINASPSSPTTATLDVYATSTDGPFSIAAYNAKVSAAPAGLTFLGAVAPSALHPGVFGSQLPNFVGGVGTGSLSVEGDLASGENVLNPNAGLFALQVQIPAGASGAYQLSFDPNSTLLTNGAGGNVPIDGLAGATITVIVPEPASAALLLTGGATLLLARRRRAA